MVSHVMSAVQSFILSSLLAISSALPNSGGVVVHSVFAYGAAGDGKTNDTAAIQRTLDAAAASGAGVAWLPSNGTYLIGGGFHALGHKYDGVSFQVDGKVTVPNPEWSTPAQCGLASDASPEAKGFRNSLCSILTVINVDRFTFRGYGSFIGYLFDEHKCKPTKTEPKPCPPFGFSFNNCTNVLVEDLYLSHFPGMMFIHNSMHVMVRNISIVNRGNPEETGDLEIGGIGSHGEPWNSPWQYEVPLMMANNITIRDSFFTGGDDNVCIKNDTANVLVENVIFKDGHGASIGSIPDCSGCHGVVTNVTFRNITMGGNAPMKIKWWPNTTGLISNILYEDVVLANASTAIEILANYGAGACPCPWIHPFGGPGQRGKCKTYHWGNGLFDGIGGNCGPEGDKTNNIYTRNITFRRVTGVVDAPGYIACRKANPCEVNFEDVQLKTKKPWVCGNAVITSLGKGLTPAIPECLVGPNITEDTVDDAVLI